MERNKIYETTGISLVVFLHHYYGTAHYPLT